MNKDYLKYSGMAFQMGAILGIFTYGGYRLDAYMHYKTPYFTIILSMTGIGLSFYNVYRDFIKPEK